MAASEASRLHVLPWQYCLSVSGPRALEAIDLLPRTGSCFWYVTVSDHEGAISPRTWNPRTSVPHIHGIIGGLDSWNRGFDYGTLVRSLRALDRTARVTKVTHAWAWIHYMVSQEKAIRRDDGTWDISGKLRHAADTFSYCLALSVPPIQSPNLDLFADFARSVLRSRYSPRARRSAMSLTPDQRRERARNAALIRWSSR